MQKQYIDKDDLLSGIYSENPKDVMSYIANFPTADVVEVVRCKDCKHYWKNQKDEKSGAEVAVCLASSKDDAFCSECVRKERR